MLGKGRALSDEKLHGCFLNSRSGPPFPDMLLNVHPLKKSKREEEGNVKVSATKWLLSRVIISLQRLFWALVWSPPEVLCICTVSAGLNWKAQSSALCLGAFRGAGPSSLAMRPGRMLKLCFSWNDAQDLITAAEELSLLRQSPSSASLLVPTTMGSPPARPPDMKLLPKK